MITYIIKRLIQTLFVLFIVTGDPVLYYIGEDEYAAASTSQEQLDELYRKFGLDKPIYIQYFNWMSGVARGDLGESIILGTSVTEEIRKSLPKTIHLGLTAFILSIVFGIPAGVICAVRRGKWLDTVVTSIANIGITAPIFWVGFLMIYLFGFYLGWLPMFGYTSPFDDFWLSLKQAIMPVFCLTIFPLAATARQTRSSMLEVVHQDYIRTAYAKGLKEKDVIQRHALKNGLIPVITLKGLTIRQIFGGQVLIESVFNVPGMGRLAVDGIFAHDYAIVQGVILLIATVVTLANLLIDISYGWLDPRIRYN
jgi:peptide/nickel transport system permease protein